MKKLIGPNTHTFPLRPGPSSHQPVMMPEGLPRAVLIVLGTQAAQIFRSVEPTEGFGMDVIQLDLVGASTDLLGEGVLVLAPPLRSLQDLASDGSADGFLLL